MAVLGSGLGVFCAPAASKSSPDLSLALRSSPCRPAQSIPSNGFHLSKARARFGLESVHPGHSLDDVLENTGFEFDFDDAPETTALPDGETLSIIRGPVAREIARSYPNFAARVFKAA